MPVHRSPDESPNCVICHREIGIGPDVIQTKCGHQCHHSCLQGWIKLNKVCPQCKGICNLHELIPGMQTRSRTTAGKGTKRTEERPSTSQASETQRSTTSLNLSNMSNEPTTLISRQPLTGEAVTTPSTLQPSDASNNAAQQHHMSTVPTESSNEEQHIQNMVQAIVKARQDNLLQGLESRIVNLVEKSVETSLINALSRMQLPNVPNSQHNNPETQSINNSYSNWRNPPLNHDNITSRPPNNRNDLSPLSTTTVNLTSSGRIAQLIANWEIKFDGSGNLSVESFIYRIETQVLDTLNGNFHLLCEHLPSLFSKEAKEWYWRYRRSVSRITWPDLCQALRNEYGEHRSDTDIKETMRSRKQGTNEKFEDYKNSIMRLAENLQHPIAQTVLVEILQRGLKPRVRQQLLYVTINTVADLRKYCLKSELLQEEITKTSSAPSNMQMRAQARPIRQVNEVNELADEA